MTVKAIGHNFGRGQSQDYHIQVWFNLAWWFLRKLKCKKLTDNGRYVGGKAIGSKDLKIDVTVFGT